MKFIHLSDLHIGKSVNNFSMLPSQVFVFAQIIEYVKTCPVDAILLSGDIYDSSIPSGEAVKVFDNFLTDLTAATSAKILIISGNHDSPDRLSFASRLLENKGIYVYATFDGSMKKITLEDQHGPVDFWLLPFIKPSTARNLLPKTQDPDSYSQIIAQAIQQTPIDPTTRNVLLSHQYYSGSGQEAQRSESELDPIGGLDAVDVEIIQHFDYVALGHLHAGQRVKYDHIRYSGSPIKYSLSEINHHKSIPLITMEAKGQPLHIDYLPITPHMDMRELKGNLADLLNLPPSEDYLRIILTDEIDQIDPMGKLSNIYPNIMYLGFENSKTQAAAGFNIEKLPDIKEVSTMDLFSEFFLQAHKSAMTAAQQQIVMELLEGADPT